MLKQEAVRGLSEENNYKEEPTNKLEKSADSGGKVDNIELQDIKNRQNQESAEIIQKIRKDISGESPEAKKEPGKMSVEDYRASAGISIKHDILFGLAQRLGGKIDDRSENKIYKFIGIDKWLVNNLKNRRNELYKRMDYIEKGYTDERGEKIAPGEYSLARALRESGFNIGRFGVKKMVKEIVYSNLYKEEIREKNAREDTKTFMKNVYDQEER